MNTQEKFVITISREVGSGGRTIGRKLAAKLGVRYCDKHLIEALIDQFGLTMAEIEEIKGRKKNWIADFLGRVSEVPMPGAFLNKSPYDVLAESATADTFFQREKEILGSLAEQESCVIAGRSGFYVLKDHPNRLDIFIRAPYEYRVERIMRRQNLSREEAEKLLVSLDTKRENYIRRISGTSRYDARNYDLVLNVGGMSEDEAVDLILDFIQKQS
ncbi:MAG: cytidylate kinase-like family protein [Bacteroidales bacterium]|nr:cytidylate kinase-like family protein [Bacteroidales bacterium]